MTAKLCAPIEPDEPTSEAFQKGYVDPSAKREISDPIYNGPDQTTGSGSRPRMGVTERAIWPYRWIKSRYCLADK